MFGLVEGRRVEDGDTVPAGLDLNGEVLLEARRRGAMVEDFIERSVFEGSTVDVTRNPIVIEDRSTLKIHLGQFVNEWVEEERTYELIMVHIICGTGNAGIVQTALVDKL